MYIKAILCGLVAYLVGSVQSAVVLSKLVKNEDIRSSGSGNAGSTNMLRVYGVKAGIVTFLCDFLKGFILIFLLKLFCKPSFDTDVYAAVITVFIILGHCFPIFFGFRGGKGVATAWGVAWALAPFPNALIVTVAGILTLILFKRVSLGSIMGVIAFLVTTLVFENGNYPLIVAVVILFVIVILRHIENIKRLIAGTESVISFKRKKTE